MARDNLAQVVEPVHTFGAKTKRAGRCRNARPFLFPPASAREALRRGDLLATRRRGLKPPFRLGLAPPSSSHADSVVRRPGCGLQKPTELHERAIGRRPS